MQLAKTPKKSPTTQAAINKLKKTQANHIKSIRNNKSLSPNERKILTERARSHARKVILILNKFKKS